jgi:hypothetical protein
MKQKVVVLWELHRAIIYTTEMSKQVTKCHVRDAVHGVPCELRCQADTKLDTCDSVYVRCSSAFLFKGACGSCIITRASNPLSPLASCVGWSIATIDDSVDTVDAKESSRCRSPLSCDLGLSTSSELKASFMSSVP